MISLAPRTARISIIGAGPGGLTCARILQRHGIAVTVYDRDAGAGARNQGGSLDLHADDGQIALREAGLLDEFFALSRPEGQETRDIQWKTGEVVEQHLPDAGEVFKPEIDRGQLRELLLGSLEPGTVRWGHSLESVGGSADGPRTLHFAGGATVETDLVIGADGAFSRVRPAVSRTEPQYSGVSFLEARFDDADHRHADLAALIGHGLAMASDGERGLFAQRNGGGHLRVYIAQRVPAGWIAEAGLSLADITGLRAYLLGEYAAWSPRLWPMITDNDGPYTDRPLFTLPAPYDWPHLPTVTLLGDAAHLMPPVGVGVNLAMLDASELALALASAPTLGEGLRAYERSMLPRVNEIGALAANAADGLLEEGNPAADQHRFEDHR
jgi:2-polyprenyl-6-methoxyphenol hydroxylase-like FAD-dependent oxidoreductase